MSAASRLPRDPAPAARRRDPPPAPRARAHTRRAVGHGRRLGLDAEPGRARAARSVARLAAEHRRGARHVAVPAARGGGHRGRASCGAAPGRTIASDDGAFRFELLSPSLEGAFEIAVWELEPGHSSTNVPRAHPGEEANLFLQGRARLEIGDETMELARRRLHHVRPDPAAPRHGARRRGRGLRRRDQPADVLSGARRRLHRPGRGAMIIRTPGRSEPFSVTVNDRASEEEEPCELQSSGEGRVDRGPRRAGGPRARRVRRLVGRQLVVHDGGRLDGRGRAPARRASNEKVDLTMWFWGDADAPGANKRARRRRDGVRGDAPERHDQGRRAGHGHLHRHVPGRRRGQERPRHRRPVGDRPGADAGLGRRGHRRSPTWCRRTRWRTG